MNYFVKSTLFFLLIAAFVACKQEGGNSNSSAVSTGTSTGPSLGKLTGFRDNVMKIEGQSDITLSFDKDLATVVILRSAETRPSTESLSTEGRLRADKLARVFVLSGIEQIYSEGNAGLQSGMMTSKSNYCDHGVIKDDGTDLIAKTLLKNYKGKKTMIIGSVPFMNRLLDDLAGPGKYALPSDEYDHLYIVQARDINDAKVYHVQY